MTSTPTNTTSDENEAKTNVLVLYTGGTIGMKSKNGGNNISFAYM